MTDQEVKRLTRSQLIDVIYQLQLQIDQLTEEKESLQKALEDKRLRINNVGSLAEAALEVNNFFRSAQDAAEQYLSEIEAMHAEVEVERQRLLAEAQAEADMIIATANMARNGYDADFEETLQKYARRRSGKR